jgi:hypothetical protein
VDARHAHGVIIGDHGRQTNYIYQVLPGLGGAAGGARLTVRGNVESPYQGLLAFGEDDAGLFFGRDRAADEVLERLAGMAQGPALLVVSGVSGAGKSSLLRAGVLPRLAGAGQDGRGWQSLPQAVLTPARSPLQELAARVAPLAGSDATALLGSVRADPQALALAALAARWQGRLLLLVDQFEEVFTQCDDERERRAFIAALHAAATTGHGPGQVPAALVIIAVRADFEARLAGYEELAQAVQDRYLLRPMTERQLRLAITGPARAIGAAVDEELASELVRAARGIPSPGSVVAAGAGVLPLLSHALDQAWRHRASDEVLTLADYERAGGIEGSIAISAGRAYGGMPPHQRDAAREVFTRLAAASEDGPDTAARATRTELIGGKTPEGAACVDAVLDAFTAERLLARGAEGDSVEISHESLLTAWPLLRGWLDETRAERAARTRLRTVADAWAASGRDPAYLYRGTLLQSARATTDAQAVATILSPAERDFLRASSRARRRAARWRNAAVTTLATLAAAAIAAATLAGINASKATQQHAIALSRQLAAQGLALDPTDPGTARQLAVAAWAVSPTSQASSLITTLATRQWQQSILPGAPGGQVAGVAFSLDGSLLAAAITDDDGDGDGTIRLWNTATGQPRGSPINAGSQVSDIVFSPDGSLLATATNTNTNDDVWTARLWEVQLITSAYTTLCADVGPPPPAVWRKEAPGEPYPKIC